MKGATIVPCVVTNNAPKANNVKIAGNNQYFFLLIMNLKIVFKKFIRKAPSYHFYTYFLSSKFLFF